MVVGGGCGWLEEKGLEMRAGTREVGGSGGCVQRIIPSAMVVKLCPKCLVGSFAQAVCGEVEWDG